MGFKLHALDALKQDQEYVDQVRSWLRAHDLDPDVVREVAVRGKWITATVYLHNDQGQPYLNAKREVATTIRRVQLKQDPPPAGDQDMD